MITGAVIGREAELDFVQEFLQAVGGGPTALVLSGEAGIGKTILWQVGVDEARRQCQRVLTCRGVEAEAALSFVSTVEAHLSHVYRKLGIRSRAGLPARLSTVGPAAGKPLV